MKIHIVQKGDTLWEISKQYGVDFEELKAVNSHLSSPDMIMPGMKIRIPSSEKAVHKGSVEKEYKKKETQKPYKDMSPKPMPVLKEDDYHKPKKVTKEKPMPSTPKMPQMEQSVDIDNYMMVDFPEFPKYVEKESSYEKEKEHIKVMPIPMCWHPCFGWIPMFPPHHQPMMHPQQQMPVQTQPWDKKKDCGCKQQVPYPAQHAYNHDSGQQPFPHFQQMPANDVYPSQFSNNDNHKWPIHAYNPYNHDSRPQPLQPASDVYPPQFNSHGNQDFPYPAPPAYPNFPQAFQRENKDDSQSE